MSTHWKKKALSKILKAELKHYFVWDYFDKQVKKLSNRKQNQDEHNHSARTFANKCAIWYDNILY